MVSYSKIWSTDIDPVAYHFRHLDYFPHRLLGPFSCSNTSFFFFTCSPVIYTVVTEIPSSYLRSKSVSLARATYNVNVIIYGQLMPRTSQKAWWNWGAKAGFFYGRWHQVHWHYLGLLWGYFRLPETKDRTFAEIDILFMNGVSARDFPKTKVDLANQTVSREE
ncbi:hypothetical protein VC83_01434 [Pseudogymnoascus destructans]|uniref:Uncharacterized protein n=1 Tax=Pseudogymnoascus destructans TaxID=655981 RepID=A0A177AJ30_9PEZI|nr:uncharacterized protein VC83_01434 [Pseudogymnoascus destructans]OAF62077.1 hypothetical protein VC83_01434 [Pseudogymnoascus destructans]